MADNLNNIEGDVQHYIGDDTLALTTGEGLRIVNSIYQGMLTPDYKILGVKIGRRWPESTREDTSLTMAVGTEQYTWPTSTVFKAPYVIEGLNINASNDPYLILPAPDMETWSLYDGNNNAQPTYYRLLDVGGTVKLALRSKPDQADPIRITGTIEATDLTGGASSTIFLNKNSDRALGMFIAADHFSINGDLDRAMALLRDGLGLLPLYDTSPTLRTSGFIRPWSI